MEGEIPNRLFGEIGVDLQLYQKRRYFLGGGRAVLSVLKFGWSIWIRNAGFGWLLVIWIVRRARKHDSHDEIRIPPFDTYSPTPYAPNHIATFLVAAWQSGEKSIKVEPNH